MREAATILAALGRHPEGDARELQAAPGELLALMSALKGQGGFVLLDLDAVDRPEGFDLAYRFLDRGGEGQSGFFTVKVRVAKAEASLPSVMGIWKAADVLEREVWDLMGVRFEGRAGLTRILCKEDFVGHPLRKDFVVQPRPRYGERGGTNPEGVKA